LIPGFQEVRRAAMRAGALGCSISGAGPAIFAWALEPSAPAVLEAMRREFASRGLPSDGWIVDMRRAGARVIA